MRKRHGGYVLLCALNELDYACDDGDYETDSAQDLEEGADAAKQGCSLGDLFARLSRLCVYSMLHVSHTRNHNGASDPELPQTHPGGSSRPLRLQRQLPLRLVANREVTVPETFLR